MIPGIDMMKTGIMSKAYFNVYGVTEGLAKIKKHGYECIDYGDFADTNNEMFFLSPAGFEKYLLDFKAKTENTGLEISQTHGPWRWPPQDATEEDRAERFEKMERSVYGTAVLGCKNFVIHPIMPFGDDQEPDTELFWNMNYEFMGKLLEVGKKCDVVINFENMPMKKLSMSSPEATLRFVKNMNSPYFKVCLDTGHAAILGASPAEAVRLIGKEYLASLHIHDNNGRYDYHQLPYMGVIDWNDFAKALKDIGFEGTASLETGVSESIPLDLREYHEIGLYQLLLRIAGRG